MFPFLTPSPAPADGSSDALLASPNPTGGGHPLDALTLGAFSAQTSSDRTACIRAWLASGPGADQIQLVFKELSGKDKGAARLLREKLDDIKRSKTQINLAQEWAERAQSLLGLTKLNLADALAWQRDAAKAGAPLSKEPLAGLKTLLVERIKAIEDLQNRVQVQREAAVLLSQRIELLSTKPWRDAQSAQVPLQADILHWQSEVTALTDDAQWASVDVRFVTMLQASQAQLLLVWGAFNEALVATVAASQDATAVLPNVPVWADELRQVRDAAADLVRPARLKVDPEIKARATSAVREALSTLEQEVTQGHGKASAGAANALRSALKDFGKVIDDKLENQAHAALAAAGELEGWQRWRADQLRTELVTRAEDLLHRPEGQAIGGRKMQDHLRALREQWKLSDQGGMPNHSLWKRFDDACNEAHKVVEAWQERLKLEASEHRAQRLGLIEELRIWTAANPTATAGDWKGFNRALHQFGDRWRESGHIGEKLFAELQPLWQAAFDLALQPLKTLQAGSLDARQAMIDEARVLCSDATLRLDAIKSLQQRWQAEAQRVPIDRRQEQKLWDAFRQPIDDAFNRKTLEREKSQAALNAYDQAVMSAAHALQTVCTSGDAQAIRAAMADLEQAVQRQSPSYVDPQTVTDVSAETSSVASADSVLAASDAMDGRTISESIAASMPVPPSRQVVAVRGDDRPGQKITPSKLRASNFGSRQDAGRVGATDTRSRSADSGQRPSLSDRGNRPNSRPATFNHPAVAPDMRHDAPRLGDSAYKAQRNAFEQAQLALRQLAAQAHGQSLTHLLSAWQDRTPDHLPTVQDMGSRVTPAMRGHWVRAITLPPASEGHDALTALLRLEIASQTPTPAAYQNARRQLQLQMLTRRNDPAPDQTWGQDTATVLSAPFDTHLSDRLQTVLKVLLKPHDRSF